MLAQGTSTYPSRARLLSLGTLGLVAALGADTFAAEDILIWYFIFKIVGSRSLRTKMFGGDEQLV